MPRRLCLSGDLVSRPFRPYGIAPRGCTPRVLKGSLGRRASITVPAMVIVALAVFAALLFANFAVLTLVRFTVLRAAGVREARLVGEEPRFEVPRGARF